ncbi:hypothetical protein BSN85_36430 [Bradyrhizobium brasilense]|nr:hypothetical protein BSN85_36430 [Bradyrhizobium brasilense]
MTGRTVRASFWFAEQGRRGTLDEGAYYAAIESTNEEKLRSAAKFLRSKLPREAKIIDIGCSDGTFIRILKVSAIFRARCRPRFDGWPSYRGDAEPFRQWPLWGS